MKNKNLENTIKELIEKKIKCEYNLLLNIYTALKSENFPVLLTELNALSGYSVRFLYEPDAPDLFNKSIFYIKNNLKEFLHVELSISQVNSEIPDTPFILHPDNVLVVNINDDGVLFYRNLLLEKAEIDSLLNRNQFFITIKSSGGTNRKAFYTVDNLLKFIDLMKGEFYRAHLKIDDKVVSSGITAYRNFASDLKDKTKPFNRPLCLESILPQWSAINGTVAYLLGIHHFLNKKAQKEMIKTVKHFEDVLLYWREWDRSIGKNAFIPQNKPVPMSNRRRAANALNRAADAYARGIESLEYLKSLL